MIPTLETERLLLRGPLAEDFPVYRDFFADADASGAYGGPLNAELAWRVLATDIGHWSLKGFGRWAVVEKATGQMVGGCGLWWPESYPRSELTWWIIPSARRNGYALEASRAAVGFGYDSLGWSLVELHMNDDNEPAAGWRRSLAGRSSRASGFPMG